MPRLRVVVVGRATLTDLPTEELVLGDLDEEASMGYLHSRGITNSDLAQLLVQQVGGNPLTLKLVVELAKHEQMGEDGSLNIKTHKFFFLNLSTARIQRQLYKRILGHLHSEEVKQLAHPGLVLRRLTPELILKVLAKPCNLSVRKLKDAQELFDLLKKEVSLVKIEPDGALRHRQDLRLLMLELLESDEPQKVRAIHEQAVAFYSHQKNKPVTRAEEIYHRLQLGQDQSVIDSRWINGVESYLSNALSEFKGAQKAFLALRLGVAVNKETQKLAALEDWERIVEPKLMKLFQEGLSHEALELLRSRTDRSVNSPLFSLEAEILASLEMFSDSLRILNIGIERASDAGNRPRALRLSLQAADLVITHKQMERYINEYERLSYLLEGSSKTDRLEIVVRKLEIAPRVPSLGGDVSVLNGEMRELFDSLTAEELVVRIGLCHRVGGFLDLGDELRLSRVLSLEGLPRNDEKSVRHLAAEITAMDVKISKSIGEEPGILARKLRVKKLDSLTSSWTAHLLMASDSKLQQTFTKLLEENIQSMSASVIAAVRVLFRKSLGLEIDDNWTRSDQTDEGHEQNKDIVKLTGKVRMNIVEAFLDAFPGIEELSFFLHNRLERSLEAISFGVRYKVVVFDLIKDAEENGWLLRLIASAREARPTNTSLMDVASEVGLSTLAYRKDVLSGLEKIGATEEPFFDIMAFRERLGQIEAQVCRVEVGGGARGTGFLVGSDILLTADHVIAEVIEGKIAPGEVRLRFDYKTSNRGEVVTEGTTFSLSKSQDWLIARQKYGSSANQLGYALLRVANSPGAQPIGGENVESVAELRRWIEVPSYALTPLVGTSLIMVHHPQGGPLKLSMGNQGVKGVSSDGAWVRYEINTEAGSSGSPCFSTKFELMALHIGTDEEGSFGVTISAIAQDLEQQGLEGILSAMFT